MIGNPQKFRPYDDDKEDSNNYRPISVISKVIERIIHNQLYDYLITNNILSKYQSGFRPLHSTLTALPDATNEWYTNIDKGNYTTVVYLDLTKAFDTVYHSILIKKLALYGVATDSLKWFESYLCNRQQKCMINGQLMI